jgi:N-methylhydantoinase B
VRNVPVEVTEAITPLVFWRKELREGSGGAGRFRGGLGQVIEVARRDGEPFGIFATFERVKHPARGRAGGANGEGGRLSLASGTELKPKGFHVVPAGERLVVEMPGGGGHGDPAERDGAAVQRDATLGYTRA